MRLPELLLEIGTEEIPSGYLNDAISASKEIFKKRLEEERIEIRAEILSFGTCRRLTLIFKDIADRQSDMVKEVIGPPKRIAFESDGSPTKAAIGFAKKFNVSVEELSIVETDKGEYLAVRDTVRGKATSEVLKELIPKCISQIPWPKSMRWADLNFSFVRPIHWILALFDGKPIPFEIAGIKSGNLSRGHRFMSPDTFTVNNSTQYMKELMDRFVIVDPLKRKELVKAQIEDAASSVSGFAILDEDLLDTVTNMVEYPFALCGSFEREFLELPEPVLITTMKHHQRYFALRDKEQKLIPYFIAVNNTRARDMELVRKGHERVLRARLKDARFFLEEDLKTPLKDRLEELKGVVYHARLGTSYEKVKRFTELARFLAKKLLPSQLEEIELVCKLSKCDLVTEMVSEFPELQGIVGKEYAKIEGYPESISHAIYEHYLPIKAGGELPSSEIAAIVGVSDRMDTISGFFAIGEEPTGTADPYALRRHAIAILRIWEDRGWDIPIGELIDRSIELIGKKIDIDSSELKDRIVLFFKERLKNMLISEGYESELVDSVLGVGFEKIPTLRVRLDAVDQFKRDSDLFKQLVLTFKRVSNILKNREKKRDVDTSLFKEPAEKELFNVFCKEREIILQYISKNSFSLAISELLKLKAPIDRLFDDVEILSKDEILRENRVSMLHDIRELFLEIADFSRFSI